MLRNFACFAAAVLPAMICNSLSASAGDTWTGGYLGAHIGGAWGDVSVKDIDGGVNPGPFNYSPSGVFGGGTAGYNFQFNSFVFGIEGDLGYLTLDGGTTIASSNPAYHQDLMVDSGLYGDITGRAGFTFSDTLIYGKGGFAFFEGEGNQVSTKPWYKPTGTGTFTGWVAGGGIEHYIAPNRSLKVEYLHFDFGSAGGYQEKVASSAPDADDGTPIGERFHNTQSLTVDSVKVGAAFHF